MRGTGSFKHRLLVSVRGFMGDSRGALSGKSGVAIAAALGFGVLPVLYAKAQSAWAQPQINLVQTVHSVAAADPITSTFGAPVAASLAGPLATPVSAPVAQTKVAAPIGAPVSPTTDLFDQSVAVELNFSAQTGSLTPELLSAYVANTQAASLSNPALIQASALAFGRLQDQLQSGDSALNEQVLSAYVANSYVSTASLVHDNQKQRSCLARALYNEARGEPEAGQWAVAAVILNRVQSSRYPDTVCDVVYQNASKFNRCQFSFACDGKPDDGGIGNRIVRESWVKANLMAKSAMDRFIVGQRIEALPSTALYYHARSVQPAWASAMKREAQIGAHIFYSAL